MMIKFLIKLKYYLKDFLMDSQRQIQSRELKFVFKYKGNILILFLIIENFLWLQFK